MIPNPLHTCIGPVNNTYQYWVYFFVVSGIDIRIHRIPFTSHGGPFHQKLNYWWIGNFWFSNDNCEKHYKYLEDCTYTDSWTSLLYVLDMYSCKVYQLTHPFILRPHFLQFLEIWFEKSGSRKVVLQTRIFFLVREKWLTRKTGGFIL